MADYKVKDVVSLYPTLREIAHLCEDNGDLDSQGLPPYQISPCDLNSYYGSSAGKCIPPVKIDGRILTAFEITELYRQLVYQDRKDGTSKKEDGWISENRFSDTISIPSIPQGHHYWGNTWNPLRRLDTFLGAYAVFFHNICDGVDRTYPRARAYVAGNADRSRTKDRNLNENEVHFINKVIGELASAGKGKYSCLIDANLKNMRGLNVYVTPEITSPGKMEAKAFGFTYMFASLEDVPIYFISYPQFGQKNFYDKRDCKTLVDVKGDRHERCMPLNGFNARKDVLRYILHPYFSEDVKAHPPKDLPWSRLAYYLRRLRVYSFLRYELPNNNKKMQEFFGKSLVLHEAIHYRNTTPPSGLDCFKDDGIIGKLKCVFEKIMDPYELNHLFGARLVSIQACALEAKLATEAKYNERKCRLKNKGLNVDGDKECEEMKTKMHFLTQVSQLAEDAEEWMVDNEVYDTLIGQENLRELDWGDDRDVALNANEVELIKREERKKNRLDQE